MPPLTPRHLIGVGLYNLYRLANGIARVMVKAVPTRFYYEVGAGPTLAWSIHSSISVNLPE